MKSDLRHYASQTTVQLIAGALVLLFVVGMGLVWWLYAPLLGFTNDWCFRLESVATVGTKIP